MAQNAAAGRDEQRRHFRCATAIVIAGTSLAGCVSPSLEDAAPSSPNTQAASASESAGGEATDNRFVQEGALRNDAFPTFERTPVAATEQLSETDKSQLEAEMNAIRAAYGSGAISQADYRARMRELESLARTHASDVERQIRN